MHYLLRGLFHWCNTQCMSEQPMETNGVPMWTLGDRMAKALRYAGISRAEMADYLGVGLSTVSTWTGDRIMPGMQTKRLWALRCGVGLDWLEGRDESPRHDDPNGGGQTGGVQRPPHG